MEKGVMQTISRKVLKSQRPTLTVKSAKRIAANVEWVDMLSELIDNAILVKRKCVDVIVDMYRDSDDEESFIRVMDDSIGIPERSMLDVFNYGTSTNEGQMLLGKMGMGMKGAVWGLGEFVFALSKTADGNMCEVRPAPYNSDNDVLEYQMVEPTQPELDSYNHGTCIKIKRVNDKLPLWTNKKDFERFMDKLNSMYAKLLDENRVTISVYYRNSKGTAFTDKCVGAHPLMSNPRNIKDDSPDIMLGHNEPIYAQNTKNKIERQEIITYDENGNVSTKVYVYAWHKPTPAQVALYYKKSQDELYNPIRYKNSVFGYGYDKAGITILYKGKYIQFNVDQRSSWEDNRGVIIEIDDESGISFTQYKNSLVQNNKYRECLDAVTKFLKENGFNIRSLPGTPAVAEYEIVNAWLTKVKTEEFWADYFGITNPNKQIKTWVDIEVGEADILIYDENDPTKVKMIIEVKKDRCGGEEVRQLWGYMCHLECNKGMVLSGVKEQPGFKLQVDAFKKFHNGLDITAMSKDRLSMKSVNSSMFFTTSQITS
jgi:hypothetical protein